MPTEQNQKIQEFQGDDLAARGFFPSMSLRFASLLTIAGLSIAVSARADSRADYLNALKIAQAKVTRVKHALSSAFSLSSPVVKSLFGRYYRVGDSWDVAAWQLVNPMMRMTSDPEHLKIKVGRGGTFHYEVTDVKTGDQPGVVMQVTQVSEFGLGPVDPKVQELQLTMSDQMVQTQKAYRIEGRPDPVKVSPDGIHSGFTPIELFPLDVPEILTATRTHATSLPELPDKIQSVAQEAGYSPSLSQSFWIEQDDFFGRPVQMIWQQGDPWPAYMKTSTGIAILIQKRTT